MANVEAKLMYREGSKYMNKEEKCNMWKGSVLIYMVKSIPIIISIAAICFSCHAVSQQNKISLFSERYSQYTIGARICSAIEVIDLNLQTMCQTEQQYINLALVYTRYILQSGDVDRKYDEFKDAREQYGVDSLEATEKFMELRIMVIDSISMINTELKKVELIFELNSSYREIIKNYREFNDELINVIQESPFQCMGEEDILFEFINTTNVEKLYALVTQMEKEIQIY